MNLKNFYLRVLNGICLEYTFLEFMRLVCFRRMSSYLNQNKKITKESKESSRQIGFSNLNIFVISLNFRFDRRNKINEMFNKSNLSFEFIDAIHGKALKRDKFKSYFTSNALRFLSNGSIGCILSHVKVYNQIINKGIKYSLILEDDIIITNQTYIALNNLLKEIPSDFDILYLASNNSENNNLLSRISDSLYIPLYPRSGQYAYLISETGARKLIKNIFPVKIVVGGIDTIIGRLSSYGILNAYHVINNIIGIDLFSESNIFSSSKPFKKLHKTEY